MNSFFDAIKARFADPALRRRGRLALLIAFAVILVVYALFPPVQPLKKADLIGYAICHRIPDRSFFILGRQLPLCARCTGTYLGVTVGFVVLALLRRWRAGEMLSTPFIVLMVLFIAIMGIDGANSYLSLWGNLPTLYTPQNWLRAATGSLNGMALSMIVWPIFNITLWKQTDLLPPLKNVWELLGMLALDAAVIVLLLSGADWLLIPVSLITTAGILWMLTLVNTMILLIMFGRDGRAERPRDALLPMLAGLITALGELTLMGTLRYLVTGTMEWPL